MKRKLFKRSLCSLSVIGLILSLLCTGPAYASYQLIEPSNDEYNLYVEDYPDNIYNEIYAKFRTTKSNTDDYYLNLSSDESESTFTSALKKSKIGFDEDYISHFTATLWKMTDDDDKKVTDAVELLIPLPDDTQEHPEDCTFYSVSGGSAKVVPTTLYMTEDGIYYIKYSLSSYSVYGFVYNDPESYDEEEEADEDEEPYWYNTDDEIEDEDPWEEFDPDPTPTPTPKPTATPTPKPTPKPTAAPTATPKPTSEAKATATPKPTSSGSSSSGKTPSSGNIPKTGDDFPLAAIRSIAIGSGSIVVLCGLYYFFTKKH